MEDNLKLMCKKCIKMSEHKVITLFPVIYEGQTLILYENHCLECDNKYHVLIPKDPI